MGKFGGAVKLLNSHLLTTTLQDVLDADDAARVTRDLLFRRKWTAKRAVSFELGWEHPVLFFHLIIVSIATGCALGRAGSSPGLCRQYYSHGHSYDGCRWSALDRTYCT